MGCDVELLQFVIDSFICLFPEPPRCTHCGCSCGCLSSDSLTECANCAAFVCEDLGECGFGSHHGGSKTTPYELPERSIPDYKSSTAMLVDDGDDILDESTETFSSGYGSRRFAKLPPQ